MTGRTTVWRYVSEKGPTRPKYLEPGCISSQFVFEIAERIDITLLPPNNPPSLPAFIRIVNLPSSNLTFLFDIYRQKNIISLPSFILYLPSF